MIHAKFTKQELDEMVAISLEKYRLREGYGEEDVTWKQIKDRVHNKLSKAYNGEEDTSKPAEDKTLGGYVKDNFGKDKGFGLKKAARQVKRGAQVAAAATAVGAAVPAAKAAGKAVRAIKAAPGAAKGALKRFIGEASELNFTVPSDYTHFAIRKSDNKIVNGWNYSDFNQEDLRRYPKDYFMVDLEDMDVNPKFFKIATIRACKQMGIDPFDCKNWDNFKDGDWLEEGLALDIVRETRAEKNKTRQK